MNPGAIPKGFVQISVFSLIFLSSPHYLLGSATVLEARWHDEDSKNHHRKVRRLKRFAMMAPLNNGSL
jgi:hypothetical protein